MVFTESLVRGGWIIALSFQHVSIKPFANPGIPGLIHINIQNSVGNAYVTSGKLKAPDNTSDQTGKDKIDIFGPDEELVKRFVSQELL